MFPAEALDRIASRFGVDLIVQFGSTVAGQVHARSDVDVGVRFTGDPALSTVAELQVAIQRLVPERDVDLALINRADPLFLYQMVSRCTLLHGSPRQLAELKMYAFRRYQDHRRFLALERRYVRALGERVTEPAPAHG
jgi:predicted nucleotidyltransferase